MFKLFVFLAAACFLGFTAAAKFHFDYFRAGSFELKNGGNGISDGSVGMKGPSKDIDQIATALGAKWYPDYKAYIINCNPFVDRMPITVNGTACFMVVRDFFTVLDGNRCVLNVFANSPESPVYTFGIPFMNKICPSKKSLMTILGGNSTLF